MTGRKTISVAYVLEKGNYFLANSEPEQAEQRKGVASMIELTLHKTGNYRGFRYLDLNELHDFAQWQFADDSEMRARFVSNSISRGYFYDLREMVGNGGMIENFEDLTRHEIDTTRREYYS